MRERRHQSGNSNSNSNTPRPASARGDTGICGATRSPLLGRHGAATARRSEPDPSHATINATPSTKRRIHSARTERPRNSLTMPGDRETLMDRAHAGLPQLPQPVANPEVQWAVKVATQESSLKPEIISAPSAETVAPIPQYLEPVLHDFSALLRDRYDGKRSLRLAFLNWDRDKDGQLSLAEIREMVQSLGLTKTLGPRNVETILAHVATTTPTQSLKYQDFCGLVYGAPAEEPAISTAIETNRPQREDPETDEFTTALYPDADRVATVLRTKYDMRPLRQVFRHWDADKDGCVTLSELAENLRRQGIKLPRQQMRALLDAHDLNQDGRLTYDEFVNLIHGEQYCAKVQNRPKEGAQIQVQSQPQPQDAYTILKNAIVKNPRQRIDDEAISAAVRHKFEAFAPQLYAVYSAFDDDHNGKLSYTEFRQGLNGLGLHLTEREFRHVASMVDTDGSGDICFREFSRVLHHTATHSVMSGSSIVRAPDRSDPEMLTQQRAKQSKGRFDFSHLARKTKVATRHGRTPYPNTKDLLSPTGQASADPPQRFRTETSQYGSSQAPRSHLPSDVGIIPATLSLGQEEKQRKHANYAKRLDRIRASHDEYTKHTAPQCEASETLQQRRIETLHRQQQRYQSVEEHRLVQPPQAMAQRPRQATMPPYINQQN